MPVPTAKQILKEIDARQWTVTANQRIAQRCKPADAIYPDPPTVSWGDRPLLSNCWDKCEVKKAFGKFLRRGAFEGDWKKWAEKSFTDDAVYITNDGEAPLIGKEAIKTYILGSVSCIPCADYKRTDYYEIYKNRVTYYLWNDIPNPNNHLTYGNASVSILYYAGNGKFSFEEDLYNLPYLSLAAQAYFMSGPPVECYPGPDCALLQAPDRLQAPEKVENPDPKED